MKQGDAIAGRYRLLRPVGSGATGTVWAARHELLGREFALKIAGGGEHTTHRMRELFLREVQIVGKLRHPNIVDIADAGELGPGEGLYLTMELLRGESLAQRIARGPLPPADAMAIAAAVCRGLGAAHEAGVVHRDLKPENIFLARGLAGGVVPKLLDFGVSSARGVPTLDPGRIFATPAYMSPEQALGEDECDARTDVWALGVVIYEMLTGRHPFTAHSYAALLPLIIEAPYPPLPETIPAEVCSVVAGCLAKDRTDRYPGAEELRAAIERARAALPAPDPGTTASGMSVETSPELAAGAPRAPAARAPRLGLVLAILAPPIAVGVLAVTGLHRGASPAPAAIVAVTATATPSAAAPPIVTAQPSASASATAGAAPPPTVTATASASKARSPADAKPAPRPGGRPVTKVNSAGF